VVHFGLKSRKYRQKTAMWQIRPKFSALSGTETTGQIRKRLGCKHGKEILYPQAKSDVDPLPHSGGR